MNAAWHSRWGFRWAFADGRGELHISGLAMLRTLADGPRGADLPAALKEILPAVRAAADARAQQLRAAGVPHWFSTRPHVVIVHHGGRVEHFEALCRWEDLEAGVEQTSV